MSPVLVWFFTGLALVLLEFVVPGVILGFLGIAAWVVGLLAWSGLVDSTAIQLGQTTMRSETVSPIGIVGRIASPVLHVKSRNSARPEMLVRRFVVTPPRVCLASQALLKAKPHTRDSGVSEICQ